MGSRFRAVLKSMCCPASRKAKETMECHQFLLLLQDGVPLQGGAEEYVLSSQQESQGDHGVSSMVSLAFLLAGQHILFSTALKRDPILK